MTQSIDFTPFPKIARLNRDIVVTEKLDGTNAAVVIAPAFGGEEIPANVIALIPMPDWRDKSEGDYALVFAQSRTRFITPERDNYGFAQWVKRNATTLVDILGPGAHFGEWWGSGIQRKYGLTGNDKRFSLFNTARWGWDYGQGPIDNTEIPGLGVVPVLYQGPYDQEAIDDAIDRLREYGSEAAPGFRDPEGIVVWHEAARQMFKVTLKGDEAPKGAAAHANDEERVAA